MSVSPKYDRYLSNWIVYLPFQPRGACRPTSSHPTDPRALRPETHARDRAPPRAPPAPGDSRDPTNPNVGCNRYRWLARATLAPGPYIVHGTRCEDMPKTTHHPAQALPGDRLRVPPWR